jgi:hypothetical protein
MQVIVIMFLVLFGIYITVTGLGWATERAQLKAHKKDLAETAANQAAARAESDRAKATALAEVENMTDQRSLLGIAKTGKYDEVRKAALKKLDREGLLEIVGKSHDVSLALAAVGEIDAPMALMGIAKEHEDADVRLEALRRMCTIEFDDLQEFLSWIAIFSSHPDIRRVAVTRITDTKFLSAVADECKDPDVRKAALDKMEPVEVGEARSVLRRTKTENRYVRSDVMEALMQSRENIDKAHQAYHRVVIVRLDREASAALNDVVWSKYRVSMSPTYVAGEAVGDTDYAKEYLESAAGSLFVHAPNVFGTVRTCVFTTREGKQTWLIRDGQAAA